MTKKKRSRYPKLGLALGAGGALGLAHLGVLKVLHKNKIYPDFLSGTSIGAVIAAGYASGRSPEEMIYFFKNTDWKKIVDFTVPKLGLIEGLEIKKKMEELIFAKKFEDLSIPLNVISYNLTQKKKVVFDRGDLVTALRASISIPGVFTPQVINSNYYIDGAVVEPTPFKELKKMGAEVLVAVDLSQGRKHDHTYPGHKIKRTNGKTNGRIQYALAKEKNIFREWKEELILTEFNNIKDFVALNISPRFLREFLIWLIDKILYPARLFKIISGRKLPTIAEVMLETQNALSFNLAKEMIEHAHEVDIVISPKLDKFNWVSFYDLDKLIRIGEKAMEEKLPMLKKKLMID